MGNFFRNIHPLLRRDKRKDEYDDTNFAVLNALNYELTQAEQEALESKIQSSLETATGDYLDTWGDWFGVYRKDGWDDDYYRGRITRYLLLKRSTIPAIIDALVDFLNDNDAHIEIYEPWKNIFYTNKSKLNGEDHMMGYYYRFAIIDISIDRPFPPEIIEVVKAFKPAGVLFYIRLDNSKNPNTTTIKDPYVFVDVSNNTELELFNGLTYDIQGNMNLMNSDPQAVTNNIFYTNKSMLNGEDVLAGSFTHGRSYIHLASTLALSDYLPTKETTLADAKLAIGESNPDLYLQTKDTDDRSASATVKISSAEYHKAYANSSDGKEHFSNDFFVNDLNAEITSEQANLLEQGEDATATFTMPIDGKYVTASRYVKDLGTTNLLPKVVAPTKTVTIGNGDTTDNWFTIPTNYSYVSDAIMNAPQVTFSLDVKIISVTGTGQIYLRERYGGWKALTDKLTPMNLEVGKTYRLSGTKDFSSNPLLSTSIGLAGWDGKGVYEVSNLKISLDTNTKYTPAPEDYGIVQGQPNLLDGTSNSWVDYEFTSWDDGWNKKVPLVDVGLVAGDTVTFTIEYDSVEGGFAVSKLVGVSASGEWLMQKSGNGVNSAGASTLTAVIPEGVINLYWYRVSKSKNTTTMTLRARGQKLIKGTADALDAWTPSQKDSGLTPINNGMVPFTQAEYEELNNPEAIATATTNIVGRGAEIRLDFDLISYLENECPALFKGMTTEQKVAKYKEILSKLVYQHTARGTGLLGTTPSNYSRMYIYNANLNGWWGSRSVLSDSASLSQKQQELPTTWANQIGADGHYVFSAVSKQNASGNTDVGVASDGVTSAKLELQDARIIFDIKINKSLFTGRLPKYIGYSKTPSTSYRNFEWEVYQGISNVDTTKIFAIFNVPEFIKNNYAKEFELLKNELGNDEALNTLFNEFDISTSLRALVPTTDAVHTRIQIFDFQANDWYELDSQMLDLNKTILNLPVNQVVSYLNDNGLMFIRYTFDCKESREATVELDMLNVLFNYRMGDGYSLGLQSKAESWTEIAVSSLTLSKTDTFIAVGATEKLTATISPETATFQKVDWVSADETIATVDSNGVITGVHEGTTTITAYSDQKEIETNCTVDVYYPVTDITVSAESVDLSFKLTTPVTDVTTASEAVNITIKGENANG